MNILYFSNQGLSPLHLGIELQVIVNLKKEGHTIKTITCDSQVKGCFFNATKNILGCSICEARTDVFHRRIGITNRGSLKCASQPLQLPKFDNLTDLLALQYENINIGRGIASSLISLKRDYHITSEKYGSIITQLAQTAVTVLTSFKSHIAENNPDAVYLFNGRFAESHAIKELCINLGIDFFTVEVATKNKYLIFKNALPHSISARENLMNELWHIADVKQRVNVAHTFFKAKIDRIYENDTNYTVNQISEKLPYDYDPETHNVVFFNSSEDEMKVIDEWQHSYYTSQNEAILRICNEYKDNSSIQFYLRVHPNLGTVKNLQVEEIKKFHLKNLTVIDAFSTIDSYGMMNAADLVISFGSTIGIEATYAGKPSVLFGRTFYENTDSVYKPSSFQEVFELIENKYLEAKPKENTYKYAYFVSTYGQEHIDFQYVDKTNAEYKGLKIKKIYPLTLYFLIKYLANAKEWLYLHKIMTRKRLSLRNIFKLYNQLEK